MTDDDAVESETDAPRDGSATGDVLSLARSALETGPLCDPCLGRLVADRSFGLANRERGRALRVALALAENGPIADYYSGEPCWVCENECAESRTEEWAERAAYAVEEYEFDTYQVGTRVPPLFEENDRLLREDVGLDPGAGEPLKAELNREVGKRFGGLTGAEVEFERPEIQVTLEPGADTLDVTVNSAFVYGRYRKLERGIPQTEWPCNDCNATGLVRGEVCEGCDGSGYRYDQSVEGFTALVIREAMGGSDATFHGAGREDVDALMLGTGRPFVVEIDEPRERAVDTDALGREIDAFADGNVEVVDLHRVSYEMVERVKELDAAKTYRIAVAFDAPVTDPELDAALEKLRGATVRQRTPRRVDHRRADLTRTREVYGVEGETDDRGATVELRGEGGLYVKELVSGDGGRTEPSLAGLLGVGATVERLDVVAVEGESEPFLQPEFVLEDDDGSEDDGGDPDQ